MYFVYVFFFKQNAAYEWRIRDWSSDVCSSDLARKRVEHPAQGVHAGTATVAEQDHRSFGRRVGCARENFLIPGRFCGVDLIDAQHQAADLFVANGRASCRERGWHNVTLWVVALSLKKKIRSVDKLRSNI